MTAWREMRAFAEAPHQVTSEMLLRWADEVRGLEGTERFHAIRLTDGEMIYGEYSWMSANGPDDWTVAEESEHDEPTEYEIVEMIVRPIARRTFGESTPDEVDEWPAMELPADADGNASVNPHLRASDEADGAQRCPWAITFGTLATRCYLPPHTGEHAGHGLAEFPYQIILWQPGDRRELETTCDDVYAWSITDEATEAQP